MGNTSALRAGRRTILAKTCTRCCFFKQAREFRIINGLYQANCRECDYKINQDARKRKAEAAENRLRRRWSGKEVMELEELMSQKKSVAYIASVLGRSVSSVERKKAHILSHTSQAMTVEEEIKEETTKMVPFRKNGVVRWRKA